MKRTLLLLGIITCLAACGEHRSSNEQKSEGQAALRPVPIARSFIAKEREERAWMDSSMNNKGFVDLHQVNTRIFIDLKYAGTDNFMHMKLYKRFHTVYVQKDIATRLSACQDYLDSLQPGLHLLVYDGVRPLETQQLMWDALDSIPSWERSRFVSNPQNRSIHNYGAAVDLTITDVKGVPLDMGAGYDDIRKIAYPSMEAHFLQSGELTQEQLANRQLLRKVMRYRGFTPIESEWWHFNGCSRWEAKANYVLLEKEPAPTIKD